MFRSPSNQFLNVSWPGKKTGQMLVFKGSEIFGRKNKGSEIFRGKFKGPQINFRVLPEFFRNLHFSWLLQIQLSQILLKSSISNNEESAVSDLT